MKKPIVFFLLLFYSFTLAQGIKFEQDTFKNILAKAKKEKKLVFLDAYASWCGPCKMLERNIFPKKEVGDYYNKNFVNAHFDMEKGEGVAIARKYQISSYPTLLFIDGDGVVVHKTSGYMSVPDFIQLGKTAINPENKIESRIQKFNEGEKNPEFLLDLIKSTFNTDFNFAKKVSERYFLHKKPTELTREDAGLLMYFTKSSDDANFNYLVNNKAEVLKFVPENVLNDFEQQMKLTTVFMKAIDQNAEKIDNEFLTSELVKVLGENEGKLLSSKVRTDFYFRIQNFNEYQKAAIEYFQNTDSYSAVELHDAAWNFFLYINDKEALLHAVDWCLASVKKQEDTFNTDTLARIYYKIGDDKNAKLWAEKSIAIAKTKNAEYTSMEELLKKIKN